jgi:thiamine pyrophosphokinase
VDGTTAIVFAGGDAAPPALGRLPGAGIVAAADSGYEAARDAGMAVDLLVGDLDSISPAALGHAEAGATEIDRHPTDKEATDLELAVRAVIARGATTVIIVGGAGGRFDHLLGNTLLLGADFLEEVDVRWERDGATVTRALAKRPVAITAEPGDVVSLLPLTAAVTGITTGGLRWPLHDATLALGATRGVSNEAVGSSVTVAVDSGVLLIVHERSMR